MATIDLTTRRLPMPQLSRGGELVLDSGGGRLPTPDEARLLGIDHRHLPRLPTALPYTYQDSYGRELEQPEQRVAVLDNGRLRATFLPDLGGRLWSLLDLRTGRELLHQPDAVRFANLAIRNAWFAGGVEWNLGVTGHWGLTCEPVCAGVVDGGVLRLWAHERLLGITWRLDAWLPEDSEVLFTHAVIENPTDAALPIYWWSNIAVPQDERTRVIADAERAFHFGYAYRLNEVSVPVREGREVTWPQLHPGSADYFYLTRGEHPWIAAVGADGHGLGQASTGELRGRKMFTWGDGPGGRNWQRWLSGSSAYAEIQAGLATTQLEHLALGPGQSWRFTESYGPIQVEAPEGAWPDVVAAARRATVSPTRLASAHEYLTEVERLPVGQEHRHLRGGADAQGWGALEIAAGHRDPDPATPYDPTRLTREQEAWLALATEGRLDEALQSSAMTSAAWRRRLVAAETGWLRDLLLGMAEHAHGDTERARELWLASVATRQTPDAWRALGLTADSPEDACACLVAAHRLDPSRPRIAVEAVTALLDSGNPGPALDLIAQLPTTVREAPRIAYLEAVALVRTGDGEGAAALLNRPLVLPDLREGDLGLDRLWYEFQTLMGTHDPLPPHYDFRMVLDETAPAREEPAWT